MIVEKVGHWAAGNLEREEEEEEEVVMTEGGEGRRRRRRRREEEEEEKVGHHIILISLSLALGCNLSPLPRLKCRGSGDVGALRLMGKSSDDDDG